MAVALTGYNINLWKTAELNYSRQIRKNWYIPDCTIFFCYCYNVAVG